MALRINDALAALARAQGYLEETAENFRIPDSRLKSLEDGLSSLERRISSLAASLGGEMAEKVASLEEKVAEAASAAQAALAQKADASAIAGAIGQNVPALVRKELESDDGPAARAMRAKIDAIIDGKVEGGQLTPGQIPGAAIARPVFLAPVQEALVAAKAMGLTAAVSGFAAQGEDEAQSADWKICSDPAGENVIRQIDNSPDIESHTFTGLNLEDWQTCYLFCRHRGASGNVSAWSLPRAFVAVRGMTTRSGRVLWLDQGGEVINMAFDYWGQKKIMRLPCARHRALMKFGLYNLDNALLDNFAAHTSAFAGATYTREIDPVTDAQLQAALAAFKNDKSGHENTEVWVRADGGGSLAALFCRNVNIAPYGPDYFDLPNIYELAVMFVEADEIDSLDESLAQYRQFALGRANSNGGRFYFAQGSPYGPALSSTEANSSSMLGIRYDATVRAFPKKDTSCGVIPCRAVPG